MHVIFTTTLLRFLLSIKLVIARKEIVFGCTTLYMHIQSKYILSSLACHFTCKWAQQPLGQAQRTAKIKKTRGEIFLRILLLEFLWLQPSFGLVLTRFKSLAFSALNTRRKSSLLTVERILLFALTTNLMVCKIQEM